MLSSHDRNGRAVSTVESVFKTSTKGEIFNFARDNNKKIDVYSGVQNLVKESTEFSDLSVPKQNYKVGMINEFLEKFIMFTGQKGELKLDKVIYKEIKKRDELKVSRQMLEEVLLHLQKQLENCSRNRKENMRLQTLRNWPQEAKTQAFFFGCQKLL